jgi:hypothetical protein
MPLNFIVLDAPRISETTREQETGSQKGLTLDELLVRGDTKGSHQRPEHRRGYKGGATQLHD